MTGSRLLVPISLALVACAAVLPAAASQPITCGKEWINLHQKNADLVGVYVQQLPDNKADEAAYRGKHPAMVIYVFKGGKVHQVEYTPSGQIETGFWSEVPANHWIYGRLDSNLKEGITCGYWVKP